MELPFYEANGEAQFWLCSVDVRDDLSVISVPAGIWLVLDYRGSYSEISNFVKTIYRDIGKQINCSLAHKIDMERYSNGGVKLCFLLK